MEQSPSWEANSRSANQDITHHLWNPEVISEVKGVKIIITFYLHLKYLKVPVGPIYSNTERFPKLYYK
jgi:hypothetical protein